MKIKDYNLINWHEHFIYDATSPSGLRWKNDRFAGSMKQIKRKSAGDVAGTFSKSKKDGYARYAVSIGASRYLASRIIYCMHHGHIDNDCIIDHINGDSTDNRIENLRTATLKDNTRNKRLGKNNTSGVNGVRIINAKGTVYASARWNDESGKLCERFFGVKKYGINGAMDMAIECRINAVNKLNASGAGYTERHGKEETEKWKEFVK